MPASVRQMLDQQRAAFLREGAPDLATRRSHLRRLKRGNRVMLKPSEFTPATSALLAGLLGQAFSVEQVAVVTGGPDIGAAFASLPFDHLFFTGSTPVGRKVMQAASEHLVPVTLELGGKSSAIVERGFPLDRAAGSIANGKLFNAGQTCISPDYVLVPAESVEPFIAAMMAAVRRLYPTIAGNPDFTSIVNEGHHQRLTSLYLFGGAGTGRNAVLARTTSGDVTINDTLMHIVQEDLPFGGIGASGMGSYHGYEGFRTFSHAKGVFTQSRFNAVSLMRPPYGKLFERILQLLLR